MTRHFSTFLITLPLSLLLVSCSFDSVVNNADSEFSTRSIELKDYNVTIADARLYVAFKSSGNGVDHTLVREQLSPFKMKDTEIVPYPEDDPLIFIINYPNERWEVLSSDKRTAPVLAAGMGCLKLDEFNPNRTSWIKSMAEDIKALKSFSDPIENESVNIQSWVTMLEFGEYMADLQANHPDLLSAYFSRLKDFDPDLHQLTRSTPDTSAHPVPGHYQYYTAQQMEIPTVVVNHLTSTKWGEGAPYNQYCPIDANNNGQRAPAGSEAVAGGQLVYYMHYWGDGDICPEVYSTAFCTAHIGDDPMDWTNMEQFDKSSSNWANFQTSDSTRMAAVLLANIGSRMQMNYGVNYSYGDLTALQAALADEYGLESYDLPFVGGPVDPYTWIRESIVDDQIPVIAHSAAGNDNTPAATFLIDGYKSVIANEYGYYKFVPDDANDFEHIFFTEIFLKSSTTRSYYCMNWGRNGTGSNDWCVVSGDWKCASIYDHSNRQSFLSFRMQGEDPWAGTGN